MKAQIPAMQQKMEKFLQRLVETDNTTAIEKYEDEIAKIEEQKVLLQEKIAQCGRPLEPFEECFRTAMTFLSNPCYLWSSDSLEDKRMVLRMVFAGKLPYQPKEGFRTAKTEELSLPFKLLKNLNGRDSTMVRPAGIEPATLSLEG